MRNPLRITKFDIYLRNQEVNEKVFIDTFVICYPVFIVPSDKGIITIIQHTSYESCL